MAYIYIAASIVMLLLIVFTSFSILSIAHSTTKNIRDKTLDLLSIYDILFEEKSIALNELQKACDELSQTHEEEPLVDIEPVKTACVSNKGASMQSLENLEKSSYLNSDLAKVYQEIRSNFSNDIHEVMNKVPTIEENDLKIATSLFNELSYENMFSMTFMTQDQQLECMTSTLDEKYMPLLKDYMEHHDEFTSIDFYGYIKDLKEEEDTKVTIYVSKNTPVQPNEDVNVVVRDTLCEGIQVEMNHTLYDFAIEKKEIGYVNTK